MAQSQDSLSRVNPSVKNVVPNRIPVNKIPQRQQRFAPPALDSQPRTEIRVDNHVFMPDDRSNFMEPRIDPSIFAPSHARHGPLSHSHSSSPIPRGFPAVIPNNISSIEMPVSALAPPNFGISSVMPIPSALEPSPNIPHALTVQV
jgi:hypothetical protein